MSWIRQIGSFAKNRGIPNIRHYVGTSKMCLNPYVNWQHKYTKTNAGVFGSLQEKQCHITSLSTESSSKTMTVDIQENGKKLILTTERGEVLMFESVWLRFNCQCGVCIQDHTGTRLIDPAAVDFDISVKKAHLDYKERVLRIAWDDHEGEIPIAFLMKNNFLDNGVAGRFSWKRKQILPILNHDVTKSKHGILQWMREINDAGICLLTNVPTEDQMVVKVAEYIAPVHRTIYGKTFDVKTVNNPINPAYTNDRLDYHMDLLHYEFPPGIQFLHCIRFDDCIIGGESILLDIFNVAEMFRDQYPDDFKTLTRIPVIFQKIHYKRDQPVDMAYRRPHIIVNDKEEILNVYWAPPFEGPLSVPKEDVIPYYQAYLKFAKLIRNADNITVRLKPGDVLAMNNRKNLHGRNRFSLNGGVRFLQGCYITSDDFRSQIKVLSNQTGNKTPVKSVGNQL